MKVALLVGLLMALAWKAVSGSDSTLRLLHVIFRHGNRNPESGSIWDGNSYQNESFYPEGFGQLTNAGKLTEYKLGQLLRARYDQFLGDIWNINIQSFQSTGYNRTKMSGLLVNAGLWPPKGPNVWNDALPWQPIPYNYLDVTDDPITFPLNCPTFATAYAALYASDDIQNYLAERYGAAMEIISANTGIETTDYYTAFGYFDAMKVQTQLGLQLDEWALQVYPEPLNALAVDFYYIWTNTTELRRIVAGTFLNKVLADSRRLIDGTLTPSGRKVFLYSAHDANVGSAILSLDAYNISQTPPYGSSVVLELHQIGAVWGIKLVFIDYEAGSPHEVSIPGCAQFCPIDQFSELLADILPDGDVCNES